MRLLITLFLLSIWTINFAQTSIVIDESFEDWADLPVYTDFDNYPGLDLLELQITNDENNVYVRFSIDTEVSLVNELQDQELKLYLDTDQNPETGQAINDQLGAELIFNFLNKSILAYGANGTSGLSLHDLEFRAAPTVSATEFEISINRNATLNGNPLFDNDSFSIGLIDDAFGDEFLSDQNGETLSYNINDTFQSPFQSLNLNKANEEALRILAYNVKSNGFNNNSALPSLERIIKSMRPDLIAISEAYDTSAEELLELIEEWLPENDWYASKNVKDLVTISKFPIINEWPLAEFQHPTLLDLPDDIYETDLLLTNAHLSCCANNEERQVEVDQFARYILAVKANGSLPEGTPFVYCGDLNLVGYAQQLNTLLNGEIQNPELGEGGFLDWDDSPLSDARPVQSDDNMTYTWISENSDFPPGRLDFQIFSDAVMSIDNSFVLNTETMSDERLDEYGLESYDVSAASDHLPVVVDYIISPATSSIEHIDASNQFSITSDGRLLIDNWQDYQSIQVYDVSGRRLLKTNLTEGFRLDRSTMNGVYLVELRGAKTRAVAKFVF